MRRSRNFHCSSFGWAGFAACRATFCTSFSSQTPARLSVPGTVLSLSIHCLVIKKEYGALLSIKMLLENLVTITSCYCGISARLFFCGKVMLFSFG